MSERTKKNQEDLRQEEIIATSPSEQKVMIAYEPDFINKVGDYLAKRPWNEVNDLLLELQKGMAVNVN